MRRPRSNSQRSPCSRYRQRSRRAARGGGDPVSQPGPAAIMALMETPLSREERRRSEAAVAPVTGESLVEAAAELARRVPEIDAIYLFGSRGRGTARPNSDVDLAVLLRPGAAIPDRLELTFEWTAFFESRLGAEVDLVLLNTAIPPGLLFSIFERETILFARVARDPERAHRFACSARAEYRDLLPRRERAWERLRRRIEERAGACLSAGYTRGDLAPDAARPRTTLGIRQAHQPPLTHRCRLRVRAAS